MPLPIGCSTITVPSDVRSPNGYWFAGLFRLSRSITQLDPMTFLTCVAGFLPHLVRRRMVISSVSLDCFQVSDEGGYQLYVPSCELDYNTYQGDMIVFKSEIADLLPMEGRLKHAMAKVKDLRHLIRHPAFWSLDEDIHFLTILVADGWGVEFPDLDALIKGRNWATDPMILEDVRGTSEFWERQKARRIKSSVYDTSKAADLARYKRNKLVHFGQLDPKLQNLFGNSRKGVCDFCNNLIEGGDLVHSFWEAINCNHELSLMKDFWVE